MSFRLRGALLGLALASVAATLACTGLPPPPLMPDGSLASRGRLNEPWGIAADADAIYFAEDVPGAEQGAIRRLGLEDGRISTLGTSIATDSAVVGMLGNTLVVNESLVVRDFYTRIQSVPAVIIARPLGFTERDFFELSNPADAQVPKVQFQP